MAAVAAGPSGPIHRTVRHCQTGIGALRQEFGRSRVFVGRPMLGARRSGAWSWSARRRLHPTVRPMTPDHLAPGPDVPQEQPPYHPATEEAEPRHAGSSGVRNTGPSGGPLPARSKGAFGPCIPLPPSPLGLAYKYPLLFRYRGKTSMN